MEATPPKSEEPCVRSRYFQQSSVKIKTEEPDESRSESSAEPSAVPADEQLEERPSVKVEETESSSSSPNNSATNYAANDTKHDDQGSCNDAERSSSDLSDVPSSYDPESSSDSDGLSEDDQDVGWRKTKLDSKRNRGNTKKKRFIPKNAREFVARMHEKEDEEEDTKRKRKDTSSGSRKSQKTSRKRVRNSSKTLLDHLNDLDADENTPDNNATAMPAIDAKTHKAQFSQLLRVIPSDCDTRHTNTQKRDLKRAVRVFGYKKVKAANGKWRLDGMISSLELHQQTASAWMVMRELARTNPYGGMLGDAMGLGKTVVSLNTVVGNPPEPKDIEEFSGATLVVVPNRDVAVQWKSEIRKHCKTGKTSTIYSKENGHDVDDLGAQWIVITTYPELVSQYLKKDELKMLKEKYENDTWSYDRALKAKLGRLFQVKWYRVILDEAHAIKNHNSSCSSPLLLTDLLLIIEAAQACWELVSKYRWVLSGTPLSNRAEEFYPYLRFLDCESLRRLTHLCPINMCMQDITDGQFDALIALIMYRRTAKDTFLGRRIIDLPGSEHHDLWIPLSREEGVIYEAVDGHYAREVAKREEQKQKQGNGQKDATVNDIHTLQLGRCTRLRQAISHTFNLERLFREKLDRKIVGEIKSSLKDCERIPITQQLQTGENFATGLAKYSRGLQRLEVMGSSLGGDFDMEALLTMMENEQVVKDLACSGCAARKPPVEPIQGVNCEHIYCRQCMWWATRPDIHPPVVPCRHPGCSAQLQPGNRLVTPACVQSFVDMDKQFREAGRDSNGVLLTREKDENFFFMASCRAETGVSMPPSSKLTATMAVILTWLEEAPNDKIIVFTEFIMSAKALGRMMAMMGLKFLYYNGSVGGQVNKANALQRFQEDDKQQILLASMKCGGQSLNLTVANRVIIVDPWWNKTQEQQAFGRVVRMGQKKTSHLVRILTEDRIDKGMTDLQNSKSVIVDRALQDDGHVPAKLTGSQLKALFAPQDKNEPGSGRQKAPRVAQDDGNESDVPEEAELNLLLVPKKQKKKPSASRKKKTGAGKEKS
ncbi:hypothetical protein AK830_g11112 [Neonectria ditissima]|uniref:Uncharacterized protein n=1 Tax=Neonectria ditissima TaxID=78410 RepID=A0A0P7B410_9HYPO|nr:hypothetical protein AK830_g11112 [Neonectria ditissima]